MRISKRKTRRLVLFLLFFALAAFSTAYRLLFPENTQNTAPSAPLAVTVLDVGQGSSTLVQAGETAVLIDCGERESAADLRQALLDAKVSRLDLLIVTHLHTDHYGGALDLLGEVPVDELLLPETPEELLPTAPSYEKFLDAAEKNRIPLTLLSAPEARTLADGVTLSFLDGFLDSPQNLNNTSLIIRLDCKDASFLITGDAETEQEDALRLGGEPIDADILVAGHHGSSTSSRQYFVNAVTPIASAISVGAGNSYNLPNEHTVERLAAFGPIYRTDLNGNIRFETDGALIHVFARQIDDTLDAGKGG